MRMPIGSAVLLAIPLVTSYANGQEERAIAAAVQFLAETQDSDGAWSAGKEATTVPLGTTGVTSLSVLALIESGQTPTSGAFKQATRAGVSWLEEQQRENGRIGIHMAEHGMALAALAHAQGDGPASPSLNLAIEYAISKAHTGLWEDGANTWMLLGLKHAEDAGARFDSRLFVRALEQLEALEAAGQANRAELECVRRFLGLSQNARHQGLITERSVTWDRTGDITDPRTTYLAARALDGVRTREAQEWFMSLSEAFTEHQDSDGGWETVGAWGRAGGRNYVTALAILCLDRVSHPVALSKKDPTPLRIAGFDDDNDLIGIGGGFGGASPKRDILPEEMRGVLDGSLRWLAAHQDENGAWDPARFMKHDVDGEKCDGAGGPNHKVGVTGLALLAFLGDGNSLHHGPYKETVARAAKYLRSMQDEETGLIGEPVGHTYHYGHAISTLALSELYNTSRSSVLKETCQRAANYIARARNPYGAWRYDCPPVGDNDTSVTGWMLMAVHSAQDAGLKVDREAFHGGLNWIDEVTDPATGRVGYDAMGSHSSRIVGVNDHFPAETGEAMTAIGLFSRFLCGQHPDRNPMMAKHADLMLRELPRWDPANHSVDMYYWLHGSYAMFQMGGAYWKHWSDALLPALVETQRKDGNAAGSWDPVGPWGPLGGRVFSTAVMSLCLQSQYRYARITESQGK